MKPTVYVETTVISYLTARPSRDLVVAAHQQISAEWWQGAAKDFNLFVSAVVLDEIAQGDAGVAARRLELVASLPVLPLHAEVEDLAQFYAQHLSIPDRALADCYHLALATWHGMDFLVSWNMAHLVNGILVRHVHTLNDGRGLKTPVLCTPEELMETP